MNYKELILLSIFILLSVSQLKAQKLPDLQLNYPWTQPIIVAKKNQVLAFKIPNKAKPLKKQDQRNDYHLPIATPEINQRINMPIAPLDTSIHYHIRIQKFETPLLNDRKK